MKMFKLTKVISSVLIATSVFALNPIGASAAWKKDFIGWRYTLGNSFAQGWRVIDGQSYFFMPNGYMEKGWIKFYDGYAQKGLINYDKFSWYYLDSVQGNLVTGWRKIDGDWYYLNKQAKGLQEKGFMQTGWLNYNGSWYYFYDHGPMATGFIDSGRDVYYLDESNTSNIGIMKTGWQKIDGDWYYFNTSSDSGTTGAMKKGWHKIKGTWYYFYNDGKMAADTWVDVYYIDPNGAWIPNSNGTNGNSEIFRFADEHLEQAVRSIINKPTGTLYKSDVKDITALSIPNDLNEVTNLVGIENLVNLEYFEVPHSKIKNLSPLKGLTKLKYIGLPLSEISDLSPLKELTNLQIIIMNSNHIKDISVLKGLTNLQMLSLRYNNIGNISALSTLTNLQYIDLGYNELSDISPLSSLTNLQGLDLCVNQISDVSPLSKLTQLRELSLEINQLRNINPLNELTNLTKLDLHNNYIYDINALKSLINSQDIDLSNNPISDADKKALKDALPECNISFTYY